jgi:hypothetical protein
MFKEFSPTHFKRNEVRKQQKAFYSQYHTPSLPKSDSITNSLIFHASNLGGVIADGTALRFYNTNWRTSDVDIVTKHNKVLFANQLVKRLQQQHGNRFKIVNKNRAVSIYDNKTQRFVADVVNYPIEEEQIIQVKNGGVYNIANPDYVFKGKLKNVFDKANLFKVKLAKMI